LLIFFHVVIVKKSKLFKYIEDDFVVLSIFYRHSPVIQLVQM